MTYPHTLYCTYCGGSATLMGDTDLQYYYHYSIDYLLGCHQRVSVDNAERMKTLGPQNPLIEALAEAEHQQWMAWSKTIAETEQLTPERLDRWRKLWIPYTQLPEHQKDQDRLWATTKLQITQKHTTNKGGSLDTTDNIKRGEE
jgi:hypothetical protein